MRMRDFRRWMVGCVLTMLLAASGLSAGTLGYRLIDAAKTENYDLLKDLLVQGSDVNVRLPDGGTALHWAVYRDSAEITGLLIGAGAAVNAENDYGVTPLALACENGSPALVALLLRAGADPNYTRVTGETSLMTCARTGNLDTVRDLVAHGADINAREPWNDQTALMWAVGEGHLSIARSLIEHGADVNARSKSGFTALLLAARVEAARALVELLLDYNADVNVMALDGTTPLLVATVRGNVPAALELLERGADPNVGASSGYLPLHWAAGSWHTELTGDLRGIETSGDAEWRALNGVQVGKLELVNALLAYGADPDSRLVREPPQFGFASRRFRVNLVGATPFSLAAMDGNVAVMRVLSDAGADPTLGTGENTTPLMLAAGLGRVPAETRVSEKQSLESIRFLLPLVDDLNQMNDAGRTALHGAAHIRSDAVVRLLVEHGAVVNVTDKRGISPLMIAEGGGHILLPGLGGGTTAELLRELGGATSARGSFIEVYRDGPIR